MPSPTPDELLLRPRPPFRFGLLAARLAAWSAAATESDADATRLRTAVRDGCDAWVATVRPVRDPAAMADPDRPLALRLTAERDGHPADAAALARIAGRLRGRWGLDDDLAVLDAAARDDPAFAAVWKPLRGLRRVRHASLTEALAWALVRQRTPHRFAVRSVRALRDALGTPVDAHGRVWRAFPAATTLADPASRAATLGATNNVRKTERLCAAAAALGTLDAEALRSGPVRDARTALSALPGVGPWTADYLLAFGVGRADAVPWTDTGLGPAIESTYAGGLSLDPATRRELAGRFDGAAGLWAYALKRTRGWDGY